jgi:hypothetical protein
LKALSLVLNTSGSLAAVWKESQGTEPRTHLLEGNELGIEYIWVPGSCLEGELRVAGSLELTTYFRHKEANLFSV